MIYLDNAATSYPKPPEVAAAVAGVLSKIGGNPGRAGHPGAIAGGRILDKARELAAQLLGGEPDRVIFCLNCTDAINTALRGVLCRGDEVLISHGEHNAVMRVLMGYLDAGAITLRVLSPDQRGIISPDTVAASITPRTALCVMCHASNVTGVVQPAAQIAAACHLKGVPLLLDAAQTAGVEDLSQIPADLIAMPGHKGLMGPMGTGILYVGKGMLPRPFREGGTGSLSDSMRQPDILPDRLESGTHNLPGIAGLIQGMKFVLRHQAAIAQYEHALAQRLRRGLAAIPGVTLLGHQNAPAVAVVGFNIGDMESGRGADLLARQGFALRGGLHCAPAMHQYLGTPGALRASFGPFNTEGHADALVDAVYRLATQ